MLNGDNQSDCQADNTETQQDSTQCDCHPPCSIIITNLLWRGIFIAPICGGNEENTHCQKDDTCYPPTERFFKIFLESGYKSCFVFLEIQNDRFFITQLFRRRYV